MLIDEGRVEEGLLLEEVFNLFVPSLVDCEVEVEGAEAAILSTARMTREDGGNGGLLY
jgi:hypothetical protein